MPKKYVSAMLWVASQRCWFRIFFAQLGSCMAKSYGSAMFLVCISSIASA